MRNCFFILLTVFVVTVSQVHAANDATPYVPFKKSDTKEPFDKLLFKAMTRSMIQSSLSENELQFLESNFQNYIKEVFGSFDNAEAILDNDLDDFANRFSKTITLMEKDIHLKAI